MQSNVYLKKQQQQQKARAIYLTLQAHRMLNAKVYDCTSRRTLNMYKYLIFCLEELSGERIFCLKGTSQRSLNNEGQESHST